MMTDLLHKKGHSISSFIRINRSEKTNLLDPRSFKNWLSSQNAHNVFEYNTQSAMTSDVVIYLGPSGPDTWAEIGVAFGCNNECDIIGITNNRTEKIGLNQKMIKWFDNHYELIEHIDYLSLKQD